jgi:hypothetical protein
MPIENSIDNLAAAINNLAAAISGKSAGTVTAAMPGEGVRDKVPAKSQPAAMAPAATKPTATAPEAVPEVKASSSAEVPGSIDFEKQIQKPIVAMANSGKRAEAVAILSKFGVKKASEIKPEDYPAAVAAIQAVS